jgi:hypothetical protein
MRAAGFTLPEISKTEDLPKATFSILQAAAAGKITFHDANELAKLVSVYAGALRDKELSQRIDYLEGLQAE